VRGRQRPETQTRCDELKQTESGQYGQQAGSELDLAEHREYLKKPRGKTQHGATAPVYGAENVCLSAAGAICGNCGGAGCLRRISINLHNNSGECRRIALTRHTGAS
jgi:hypothetical protein